MTRSKIGLLSNQGDITFWQKRSTSPVFELIRAFITSLLIYKFQEDMIKINGATVKTSILWNLVVAIASKVFIQYPSKALIINPHPEACYKLEMIEISLQAAEIQLVKGTETGRTLDRLVYYKLPLSLRPSWTKKFIHFCLFVCFVGFLSPCNGFHIF